MLRGIIEQKKLSREGFEARQNQIQDQALKRFMENNSKRDSSLEKISLKVMV